MTKGIRRAPGIGVTIVLVSMLVALAAGIGDGATGASADEGWVVRSFDAQIGVQSDGTLRIAEVIAADFGSQTKHGIYRDIPVVYDYDASQNRIYELTVQSVTDQAGRPWRYEVSHEGSYVRIKIGDPDSTVSGPQTYRIAYVVRGALNAFADHDELYWNVNGSWPVRTERTVASVTLPGGGRATQVACYQGATGSTQSCQASPAATGAAGPVFATTRTLPEGEQLTIVVGLPKGLVAQPQPILEPKPRELTQFFEVTPLTTAGAGLVLLVVVAGLGWSWWTYGRDRQYTSTYYLSDNPAERTRPLLSTDPIVVEYQPPDKLRPAQLGLILDESADTLDVTATIVDLAVRGYLRIAEVRPQDLLGTGAIGEAGGGAAARLVGGVLAALGKHDWELTQTETSLTGLLPYEQTVLNGLFATGSPVRLSALKNHFYTHLNEARKRLYDDSMERQWFVLRPDRARLYWALGGMGLDFVGTGLTLGAGFLLGAGLVPVPLVLGGTVLMVLSHWMPKRTARGREVLRRTLGFRQYVATAETDRQRFNEQHNLFAEYLPYAIVFHCVDKWASAFRDVEAAAATQTWYVGSSYTSFSSFSHGLNGFSAAVSSTIVSTPGSSGGSGFSGGSSGGGGGGGGGGSW